MYGVKDPFNEEWAYGVFVSCLAPYNIRTLKYTTRACLPSSLPSSTTQRLASGTLSGT